jgi:hypothetical protein
MLYNQPYGVTDPDAPYINGNPATGTMGSIPPAAAIEHPQREIVNFLNDSAFTPDANDLRQLSKSVQGGVVNYCDDQGTPNFLAITPTPPLAGYVLGQHFRIKVANANTQAVQISVSGLGWLPVVHADGTPMGGGELYANQIIEVAYNGANAWQMLTGGLSGSLIMMTNPRSLYCDNVQGDDSLYDGTSATIDAAHGHGPYKSLRRALLQTAKYNLSGFTFHIYLADGTYPETSLLDAPTPNGSGTVFIHGNHANPNLVKLINSGTGSCFRVFGGSYTVDGVSFQATQASASDQAIGLWVANSGNVWCDAVAFYNAPGGHVFAGPGGGHIAMQGPDFIYGGSANGAHLGASQNGVISFWSNPYPTLNVMNAVSLYAFASAGGGGQINPVYTVQNLNGAVTGYRYVASGNGVIDVGGRAVGYLPGSVAGVLATGGQYV